MICSRYKPGSTCPTLTARYYRALIEEDRDDWRRIAREWPQIQQAWQWVSSTGDQGLAGGYINAARLYHERQGLWQSHIEWLNLGLALTQQSSNHKDEAALLNNIGMVYDALGEKQEALRYLEQALPLQRAVGDRAGEAATLNNIGMVYSALGEKQEALRYYEQALPLQRAVGDRGGEGVIPISQGDAIIRVVITRR